MTTSRSGSPCVDLCIYDYDKDFCAGCGRTLDEVSYWNYFTPQEKQQILKVHCNFLIHEYTRGEHPTYSLYHLTWNNFEKRWKEIIRTTTKKTSIAFKFLFKSGSLLSDCIMN